MRADVKVHRKRHINQSLTRQMKTFFNKNKGRAVTPHELYNALGKSDNDPETRKTMAQLIEAGYIELTPELSLRTASSDSSNQTSAH